MPRAPALFTEADIKRVLSAAKAVGVRVRVVIHRRGHMEVQMLDETEAASHAPVEENSGAGWFNADGSLAVRP